MYLDLYDGLNTYTIKMMYNLEFSSLECNAFTPTRAMNNSGLNLKRVFKTSNSHAMPIITESGTQHVDQTKINYSFT